MVELSQFWLEIYRKQTNIGHFGKRYPLLYSFNHSTKNLVFFIVKLKRILIFLLRINKNTIRPQNGHILPLTESAIFLYSWPRQK